MAASNTDWLQRRRKRTRCKKHGLHYDPSLTSGCVLCRKEGGVETAPREGAKFVPLLLSLFALAVVGYQLSSAEFSSDVQPTSRTGPRVVQLSKLPGIDAEPFREQIEQVERPLLGTEVDDLDEAVAAASAGLERLAAALEDRGPPAEDLAPRVRELIDDAGTSEVGYAGLVALRDGWLSLRRWAFEPAAWFAAPAAGVERASVLAWREAALDLADLLRDSPGPAPGSPEVPGAEAAETTSWSEWTAMASSRLASIRSELPPRPGTHADDRLLTSVMTFEQALQGSESLFRSATPASPERVGALLESAEQAASGFRQHLAG